MVNDKSIHIAVRDVTKRYGAQEVLKGVSLDIFRGQINAVIGASGSGKTVLLRQIVRLEQPDQGQIFVDGEDIVHLGEHDLLPIRRGFGMVFQMSALFDSMNVFDNVAFPLREHTKLGSRDIREKVMQRLQSLGIEHAGNKLPSELSGGMRKRVAVARALVLEPKVLFYDEPTTGLDPVTSRKVDELISETQERFSVTSVVITHDMTSVMQIANRIYFLYEGRIRASAAPAEFSRIQTPEVQDFLRASGVKLSTG